MAGVAKRFGVTLNAVKHYRQRKPPLPALAKKGKHGKLLFDSLAVDAWVAEYITDVPGEQGQEGGAARKEQIEAARSSSSVEGGQNSGAAKSSGSAGGGQSPDMKAVPKPKAEDLGIEPALRRVEKLEYALAVRIERIVSGQDDENPVAVKVILNKYKEMLEELRQLAVGLVKVKEAEGALVPRVDMLEKLCSLAAMIRGALDAFADEALPEIMAQLARKKVQIGDMTKVQRVFREAMQKSSDGWLERLSRQVKDMGGAGEPSTLSSLPGGQTSGGGEATLSSSAGSRTSGGDDGE